PPRRQRPVLARLLRLRPVRRRRRRVLPRPQGAPPGPPLHRAGPVDADGGGRALARAAARRLRGRRTGVGQPGRGLRAGRARGGGGRPHLVGPHHRVRQGPPAPAGALRRRAPRGGTARTRPAAAGRPGLTRRPGRACGRGRAPPGPTALSVARWTMGAGRGASREVARVRRAYDCDVLVIGGGIVGLSTAYAISRAAPGTRITVLEKESGPARHQTGRNSGVIHSGIYYRPGSLKARYAVRGAAEMVKFCAEYDIAHAVTGKLIVATAREELPRLHALAQRGRENGLTVRELGAAQTAEYEPEADGLAALHVGATGVCDLAAVARHLAEASGAEIRYGARVVRVDRRPDRGVAVRTARGDVVRGRVLVNCAGLHCDEIARLTGDEPGVRIVPFRGEYYE